MWYVQFHHAYFGWLTLDQHPYKTREEAVANMDLQPKCYSRRVIFLKGVA